MSAKVARKAGFFIETFQFFLVESPVVATKFLSTHAGKRTWQDHERPYWPSLTKARELTVWVILVAHCKHLKRLTLSLSIGQTATRQQAQLTRHPKAVYAASWDYHFCKYHNANEWTPFDHHLVQVSTLSWRPHATTKIQLVYVALYL